MRRWATGTPGLGATANAPEDRARETAARLGVLSLLVAGGCGGSLAGPLSPVRFAAAPPVTRVVPAFDVPEAPEKTAARPRLYWVEAMAHHAEAQLALEPARPAEDINALGDVPRSSWFRGGPVPSPGALRAGPPGAPPRPPLAILATKGAGAAIGFQARDADGRRLLLKLDASHTPEVETGAHMVVHRLVWALGYRVAEDHLLEVPRSQLRVEPDAELHRGLLSSSLDAAALDRILGRAAASEGPEGPVYRFLASRFVDGAPLGGAPATGVRAGDPNDRIPHERRRSLRGLFPIAAWVSHTDMKVGNSLDVWREGGRGHYVQHLLIDFGKALGGFEAVDRLPGLGFDYLFGPRTIAEQLFTLGLVRQPWERRVIPDLRGLGWFAAEPFEPGSWRPFAPYAPFRARDPNDDLWGALRLARLEPGHVAAAVAAGRYTAPATARYLEAILLERRRRVLAWAFRRRAPLDGFEVEGDRLCWVDWGRRALGWREDVTASLHADPSPPRDLPTSPVRGARGCVELPAQATGYAIISLRSPGGRVTEVHLDRSLGSGTRVIGVVRGRAGAMESAHP